MRPKVVRARIVSCVLGAMLLGLLMLDTVVEFFAITRDTRRGR